MTPEEFRAFMTERGAYTAAFIQKVMDINEPRGGEDWRYLLIAVTLTGWRERKIYEWIAQHHSTPNDDIAF